MTKKATIKLENGKYAIYVSSYYNGECLIENTLWTRCASYENSVNYCKVNGLNIL